MNSDGSHQMRLTSTLRADGVQAWEAHCQDCTKSTGTLNGPDGKRTVEMASRTHESVTRSAALVRRQHEERAARDWRG